MRKTFAIVAVPDGYAIYVDDDVILRPYGVTAARKETALYLRDLLNEYGNVREVDSSE